MRSDDDLKKTFKVEITDGNIMNGTFLEAILDGDEDKHRAELFRDAVHAAIDSVPGDGKVNGIIDMAPLGGSVIVPSAGAGKIYAEAPKHSRTGKVAIVGVAAKYKLIVKFFLIASNKVSKIKLFKTVDEARAWLKSD